MTDVWKLQDAKARFSELVRRARAGAPQHVTLHGKDAVVVVDPARFEVRPKPVQEETMAGFVERSKKYRGSVMKLSRTKMKLQIRNRSPLM
jgi:prevent-host-death family protein